MSNNRTLKTPPLDRYSSVRWTPLPLKVLATTALATTFKTRISIRSQTFIRPLDILHFISQLLVLGKF